MGWNWRRETSQTGRALQRPRHLREHRKKRSLLDAQFLAGQGGFPLEKSAYRRKLGVLPARTGPSEHRPVPTSAESSFAAARAREENPGSLSSVGFPSSTPAPAHLIGVGQPVSKTFKHCSRDWCSPSNSCVYERGTVTVSFGEAPRSAGIGGGEGRDGPIYLQRSTGSSCAPTIKSSHCPGVADSNSECRSSFGAWRGNCWRQYQRCTGQSKASGRAGSPTWVLLQLGAGLYGKKDAADYVHRREPRGTDESRHLGDQVLGTFWRVWEASRTGTSSVPGDDHHGLFAGGKPTGSTRCCFAAGGDDRSSRTGQWEVRLGQPPVFAGRPTFTGLHSQSPQRAVKGKSIHTSRKPAMDYGSPCLRKGVGLDLRQEVGISCTSKVKSICQFLPGGRSTKAKSHPQEEGKGVRKRKPCLPTEPGRGRLNTAVSAIYEPGKDEGPVPNPLTSRIAFHRWISCLPRWILRTHTKLAWCLSSCSFAILRRSSVTSSALLPLPLVSLDCFRGSGPGLSCKRFRSLCKDRLLNVWILVLDFLYLGRWPTVDELRRCPSQEQLVVFKRLRT